MSDVDDQLHTFKNQPILGSMDAGLAKGVLKKREVRPMDTNDRC